MTLNSAALADSPDQGAPVTALSAICETVARVPVENISSLARGRLGDPSIIPLWFGEGDVPAPAFIGQAMMRAVQGGQVFYAHQNGVAELRAALALYLTGLTGRAVGEDAITVTVSGMNAIMLAMRLIAEPGDNLIVVGPVWPNIAGCARLAGAEVREVAMDHGPAGWTLDVAKVAAAMDGRTRGVFYASPGNPTGAILTSETLAALLSLTRARGAWLVADEVYNRLMFDRVSAPSVLEHAEAEDRVLVVNSFSKSWAMTGWRLGWLVHPPSLALTLAMMVQYTTSGMTTFVQHAGVAAIEEGEPFVAWMRDYCARGMDLVCTALEGFGRVRLGPRPRAGMYAFFEVEGFTDTRTACLDILETTRVGLAPGTFFGSGAETYMRLCACRSPAVIEEAMASLAPALA